MKKLKTLILFITIIITLAACGNQSETNVHVPTAKPTATAVSPIQTAMPTANAEVTATAQDNEAKTEKAETTYIGNRKSKKFHRTDCRTLPAEKNRVLLKSRKDAAERGYSPCGNCNP